MKSIFAALALVLLVSAGSADAQTTIFNCLSGFTTTAGNCMASTNTGHPFWFGPNAEGSFSGSALNILPTGSTHLAGTVTYQTVVNVQAFTSTFTFVPNGQNIVWLLENSNNNPIFNTNVFNNGAGCEASFFQGFSQTNPPNNVFALELDSFTAWNGGAYTYSTAQVYQATPFAECPCFGGAGICGTNNSDPGNHTKLSTFPVALSSPVNSQNTTTGHTYNATVSYNGTSFILNMFDVTAGGSCPGATCYSHTFTTDAIGTAINVPASVGANTAYVAVQGATGLTGAFPLLVNGMSYTVNAPGPTPTPTATATATPSPTATPTPLPAFYVDNSGSPACSDGNAGTSTAAPWCTVAHAMAQITTFTPGSSVLFKCGDTWNETMTIPNNAHGTASLPLTIGHYGSNCALPTFASYTGLNNSSSYSRTLPSLNGGSSLSNGIIANAATGVSFITVDGFDVHDFKQGGINFVAPSCSGMPGIVVENCAVHENGGGAYAGATEGPDTSTNLCDAAAPNGAGPCDNNVYNTDAGINFNDNCAAGGNDGAQLLNNFVWDQGGHNTLRVHFDKSPNTLVLGNVVGPGCIHNCIDTKGVNATIRNNITTCPASTARSPGGMGQCGAGNAGYYTEVQGGSYTPNPTWEYNVSYDIGICGQLNGVTSSGNALAPNWFNNTCSNATGNGTLYTSSIVAPCSIKQNIFGGTTAVHDSSVGCAWDYNNEFGASGFVVGAHDINVNPTYVNSSSNPKDFHTTNSTNNTAGPGTTFIGALGGPPSSSQPNSAGSYRFQSGGMW